MRVPQSTAAFGRQQTPRNNECLPLARRRPSWALAPALAPTAAVHQEETAVETLLVAVVTLALETLVVEILVVEILEGNCSVMMPKTLS